MKANKVQNFSYFFFCENIISIIIDTTFFFLKENEKYIYYLVYLNKNLFYLQDETTINSYPKVKSLNSCIGDIPLDLIQ